MPALSPQRVQQVLADLRVARRYAARWMAVAKALSPVRSGRVRDGWRLRQFPGNQARPLSLLVFNAMWYGSWGIDLQRRRARAAGRNPRVSLRGNRTALSFLSRVTAAAGRPPFQCNVQLVVQFAPRNPAPATFRVLYPVDCTRAQRGEDVEV